MSIRAVTHVSQAAPTIDEQWLSDGKSLYGMLYTFPKRGDGIGMHDHVESQKHNTMVLKGSIQIYGPDKHWCHTLHAGDTMDLLPEHHPHELIALEDDTRVMGMFVHGRPDGEYLSEEEKQGTIRNKEPTYPLGA